MPTTQSRRRFLTSASMAGAAGFLPASQAVAAEGTLETNTVRILKSNGICHAPQHTAGELLRTEGFSDIRYVDQGLGLETSEMTGRGDADFSLEFAARIVQTIVSTKISGAATASMMRAITGGSVMAEKPCPTSPVSVSISTRHADMVARRSAPTSATWIGT